MGHWECVQRMASFEIYTTSSHEVPALEKHPPSIRTAYQILGQNQLLELGKLRRRKETRTAPEELANNALRSTSPARVQGIRTRATKKQQYSRIWRETEWMRMCIEKGCVKRWAGVMRKTGSSLQFLGRFFGRTVLPVNGDKLRGTLFAVQNNSSRPRPLQLQIPTSLS